MGVDSWTNERRNMEEWLFNNGFLKEFYQTSEFAKEIIPYVKMSHYHILENICKTEEDVNELLALSLNMLCHPLFVLAYLASKNGFYIKDSYAICIKDTSYIFDMNWYSEYKWGSLVDEKKRMSEIITGLMTAKSTFLLKTRSILQN